MPARKRRISTCFRWIKRNPFSASDWQEIERDYGWPIPSDVRKRIECTTDIYEMWAARDHCGVPVTDIRQSVRAVLVAAEGLVEAVAALEADVKSPSAHAKVIIENVMWSWLIDLDLCGEAEVQTFRKLLSKVPIPAAQNSDPAKLDGQFYRLLGRQIGSNYLSRRFEPREALRLLGSVIPSILTEVFKTALDEVDDPTYKLIGGQGWRGWIRLLTEILQGSGLPTGASKGPDDRSAFVALVRRLQERLPAPYRRHFHSHQALAKAISDARSARYRDANV